MAIPFQVAEVTVRAACAYDLPALALLRESIGWGAGGLEGSFAAAAVGRQIILLAECRGRLVGGVTVSFQGAARGAFGRGHVSDLLVAPLWRRRGIGTRLLVAAEEAIAARGVVECTLDVDAHNEAALRLYLGNGYRRWKPAQFPWGPGYTLRKCLGACRPAWAAPPARRATPWWRQLRWPG